MVSGRNIKSKDNIFAKFFAKYIEQQRVKGLKPSYIDKITRTFERYILPHFANYKINDIHYTNLLEILNTLFNPNNPQTSRLETIHRLIQHLNKIFALAIKDRIIDYNHAFGLKDEFPTTHKFYRNNDIDSRFPALINHNDIAELINDLKCDNKMDLQTKRAIYLQILCVNRPINTVSIKWEYISLDKGIWTIPANEMKMGYTHTTALNSYALKILHTQKLFSENFNYVFPALNQNGHLHRDSLSKALRNLGGKNKWSGKVTTHGFRATFRTICSQHKIELIKIGIGEEVIESVLAHKTLNEVKYAYEREKATLEQKQKLMQWYGDYLNSIEPLGIY